MKAMKYIQVCCAVLLTTQLCGQQPTMYTQYTFNKAGLNPAASGTEINRQINYVAGLNRPWLDFDNAPKQNFVNFSYTIRPPRSYRFWQNAGVYIETDRGSLLGNDNYYATYAFHLLLRKTTVASFGVFAGVRNFKRSIGGNFDPSDPSVVRNKSSLWIYPDVVPGFRISDKKYFFDVAVRQITRTTLRDFRGRRIGSPARLQPNIYVDYGRKIPMSDYLLMLPSVAANIPLVGPPVVDYSLLFFYANTVGGGLSMRNLSAASAIFQIRIYGTLTFGVAYSYPMGNVRQFTGHSLEVMVGVIPMGMNTQVTGKHSIAKCPTLSF